MRFTYKARDKEGKVRSGEVVAADQVRAEQLMTENGLVIISLDAKPDDLLARINPFGKTVSNKDLVLFSRQLSTLISARVPLLQSLRILEDQIVNKFLVSIIQDILASIENGESFSLALAKHPKV